MRDEAVSEYGCGLVVTPWGNGAELQSRRLRPGPGAPRDEVRRNQRERLYGAMVAAVSDLGYERTRVADLLAISGISRNTFYRHFSNKQHCFLATLDAIAKAGARHIGAAYADRRGPWDQRLRAALDALVELIVAQPAAARLYYVDSYAAGPEAVAQVERRADQLQAVAMRSLAESPDHADMPPDLARAVLRGLRRVIQTRLRTRREDVLPAESPQLLGWALGYRPPPRPLRRPHQLPSIDFQLEPLDRGDPQERILTAVMELMSEQGYAALRINDIAKRGAVSLSTFYALFDNKDDAVVAALRRSSDRVVEAVAPAFRRESEWPRAIAAGLRAFFAFLVAEQPFARFGGVDPHSASPLVVDVRAELAERTQAFFVEGHRQHPDVAPIVSEAIGGAVDSMLFDAVRNWGTERLYELVPLAIYVSLAPFIGAEEACALANETG